MRCAGSSGRRSRPSRARGCPALSDAAKIASARQTEPAKLAKLVRGELDWIVMKAWRRTGAGAYETANGFARDIQRYLADEPVEACPPSAGYRLHKFARKNRRVLATARLFVLLLARALRVLAPIKRSRDAGRDDGPATRPRPRSPGAERARE